MRPYLYLLLCFTCSSLFSQNSLELLGHYTFAADTKCSSLTGYADSLGNEYALVGTTKGLSIINVTNPASPVLVDTIPGPTMPGVLAREVRTYKQYAYVTSEHLDGFTIVDLSQLPNGVVTYQKIFPDSSRRSHTIFIDEHGIAYLNGTDRGQLMLDLNANPANPPVVGKYTQHYVHDCFVRNDTMWAACINIGYVFVIDVRNKANVNLNTNRIALWTTPSHETHNVWLSDDSKYLFTTDEKTPSYLTCYDVTDLDNVVETDRVLLQGDSTAIMHNTHYKDGYCYTADYTYGITMHNVSNKYNLIEEGHYDTSPYTGDGFKGAWEAWPYLPSGNVLVSDIETGLWIFKPNPELPCYVTGTIKDAHCGNNLFNATIKIDQTPVTAYSNLLGKYNTYAYGTGTVSITVTMPGFYPKTIQNVQLNPGTTLNIDAALSPLNPQGKVTILCKDKDTGEPLMGVILQYENMHTIGLNTYTEFTDSNGMHTRCDLEIGNYLVYAGKWGYIIDTAYFSANSLDTTFILLKKGYYDDFTLNYYWYSPYHISGWELKFPFGLPEAFCPQGDLENDFGANCYITAPNQNNDLDGAPATTLRSPLMDLTSYTDPYISYYRWYINGYLNDANDTFQVYMHNGDTVVLIDSVLPGNITPEWVYKSIRLKDYIVLTDSMRIFFHALDELPDNITMAAIDKFQITEFDVTGINKLVDKGGMSIYPNPFTGAFNISFDDGTTDIQLYIYDMAGNMLSKQVLTRDNKRIESGNNLPAGLYVLKAATATHTYSTKLVKLK